MQSYYDEIQKKKRASRIFWILVFSFAIFLYYFFQGYYPSINISLRQVFTGSGIRHLEKSEFIESFGIVNIRVEPRDARIQINREDIGYDEKKMVPYDTYLLSIGKPGYTQNRLSFTIDKAKPFYIDTVRLLPRAEYTQVYTGSLSLIAIDEQTWIGLYPRKVVAYGQDFSGATTLGSWGGHIGEGYFLSGETLARYERGTWQKTSWSGSVGLIRECEDTSVIVQEGHMWCLLTYHLITERGESYTGITEIGRGYIRGVDRLYSGAKRLALNAYEQKSPFFIEYDGSWYMPDGANFIPLLEETAKGPLPLIITPLDSISRAIWFDGELVVFGRKGADTFVTFLEKDTPPVLIPFPDIPLDDIRLVKYEGNTFFQTRSALLFLYNNSKTVEWLIDGEILGFSSEAALYRKGEQVWRAYWGEK